jgi:hypothetical protein
LSGYHCVCQLEVCTLRHAFTPACDLLKVCVDSACSKHCEFVWVLYDLVLLNFLDVLACAGARSMSRVRAV